MWAVYTYRQCEYGMIIWILYLIIDRRQLNNNNNNNNWEKLQATCNSAQIAQQPKHFISEILTVALQKRIWLNSLDSILRNIYEILVE